MDEDRNTSFRRALDLHRQGILDEAEAIYRSVLDKLPQDCDCLHMLGVLLCQRGRRDEGIDLISRAIKINPSVPGFHSNLANALLEAGRPEETLRECTAAIALKKDHAEAYYLEGIALTRLGRRSEAVESYRESIRFNPEYAVAYNNLGILLQEDGDFDGAFTHYERAVQLNHSYAEAYNNIGNLLKNAGKHCQSLAYFRKAISLKDTYAAAYTNLGGALKDLGRIEEALECDAKARDLEPADPVYWSNYLLTLHYREDISARELFEEHARWGENALSGLMRNVSSHHVNDPDPEKVLRIGYVSGDFRDHSVAYFIEPVLGSHNRSKFETFCYSDVVKPDRITARIRELSGNWRDINHLDADDIAALVKQDSIDILVDLAGHTGRKQMKIFALKPAPVQASYLGYPDTTGLPAMDYRITDILADPMGSDKWNTETLARLSGCFLCYLPPAAAPEPGELPSRERGYITFGSFNNRAKINRTVVQVWSEILKALPLSRLIVKTSSLGEEQARDELLNLFVQNGVERERIDLHGYISTGYDHLALYNTIDIGLDTFPYNGTTTTCEALWMGVPVITLEGNTHHSRVGKSILHHTGLSRFVATSPIDYLEKAVHLARSRDLLPSLKKGLRNMLKDSTLMDATRFTSSLESEYRRMWQEWCLSRAGTARIDDTGATLPEAASILARGEELFTAGEIEQAERLFRQLLDLDANSTVALNDLGVLSWATGRVRQAIDYFREALRIDPSFEDAQLNLDEIIRQSSDGS